MSITKPAPAGIWKIMSRLNQRMVANYRKGFGPTRMVLLLTTIGRKSGLPRVTPLQYEEIEGVYYLGSARGAQADWYRNILANPQVQIQIRKQCWNGTAEADHRHSQNCRFFSSALETPPADDWSNHAHGRSSTATTPGQTWKHMLPGGRWLPSG
jgi:F420H(2)-dependent quinone reductase